MLTLPNPSLKTNHLPFFYPLNCESWANGLVASLRNEFGLTFDFEWVNRKQNNKALGLPD